MKITLYKNCKLNNAYKNVFSFRKLNNENLIDLYLNKLSTDYGSVILEIDNTYQEGSGRLIFERTDLLSYGNIYQYNYMKIVSDDDLLLRYCFISDITIMNEVVYIDYEEDIWHSFGSTMAITKSYLSRNRLADKTNFKTIDLKSLPVKYESNDYLDLYKTETISSFNLFVEIQYYKGTQLGEQTSRKTGVYQMSIFENDDTTAKYNLSMEEIEDTINKLISCQASKSLGTHQLQEQYYYNVGDIFIVPSNWNIGNYFYKQSDRTGFYNGDINVTMPSGSIFTPTIYPFTQGYIVKEDYLEKRVKFTDYNITTNRRIKSIGTYTNQIEVEYNGLNYNVELYFIVSMVDFKLYMSFASSCLEITNDFKYDAPFTSTSGEENALNKLDRTFTNIVKTTSLIGKLSTWGADVTSLNLLNKNLSRTLSTDVLGEVTNDKRKLNQATGIALNKLGREQDINKNIAHSSNDIIGIVKNNAPVYSSSRYTISTSSAVENAINGICYYYYVETSSFRTYMTNCIDNSGFTVYEWINNFEITGINSSSPLNTTMVSTYKYNYIQFSSINVYGQFSRSIARYLENILLKGTKVWFNYTNLE